MSQQALRGGLVGCGYVCGSHLEGWRRQPDARVVAVCDLDLERAQSAARAFAIPGVYADVEQMLDEERLDFLEICTRPDSHERLLQTAANRGLPALCQKPIAPDLASIDRMIATASARGTRVMVHENWRFRPWYARMAEIVRGGSMGRPIRFRLAIHDERCVQPGGLDDQPYFATMDRFILYEMGPHAVDVARQVLGDPDEVYAALSRIAPITGEDAANLVLRYADQKTAILDMNWSTPGHPEDHVPWGFYHAAVEGTEGTLTTEVGGQLSLRRPGREPEPVAVDVSGDPRITSYAAAQRHFLDCLKSGADFATSLEDARRTMAVVFAGYASATSRGVARPQYL